MTWGTDDLQWPQPYGGPKRTYVVMLSARELDYLLRLATVEAGLDAESRHLPDEADDSASSIEALRAFTSPHKGKLR